MTLVLSDKPKAVELTARLLREKSPNIHKVYTQERLELDLWRFMADLKAGGEGGSIGTAGFVVHYTPFMEENCGDEFNVYLTMGTFHGQFTDGSPEQQFVHDDGPWRNDHSVPAEWRDDDFAE